MLDLPMDHPVERRLIMLRHAKSAWNTNAPTDHDRPLNKRGRRDAPRIGAKIRELGWSPERVISSDSQRTRETWDRMKDEFEPCDVTFTRRLYHESTAAVLEVLAEVPDSVATVMLIGHNPGWETAIAYLTGKNHRITTCNAALMTLPIVTWSRASEVTGKGKWTMHHLLRPKEL